MDIYSVSKRGSMLFIYQFRKKDLSINLQLCIFSKKLLFKKFIVQNKNVGNDYGVIGAIHKEKQALIRWRGSRRT